MVGFSLRRVMDSYMVADFELLFTGIDRLQTLQTFPTIYHAIPSEFY